MLSLATQTKFIIYYSLTIYDVNSVYGSLQEMFLRYLRRKRDTILNVYLKLTEQI